MNPLVDPIGAWRITEVVDEPIRADGLRLHRAGLTARDAGGMQVMGSATRRSGSALQRARYELVERIAVVEAMRNRSATLPCFTATGQAMGTLSFDRLFPGSDQPTRWQFARSSGVALGHRWEDACARARWELVERDRLLRSWYGQLPSASLGLPGSLVPATRSYQWRAHRFPGSPDEDRDLAVIGVFGIPTPATRVPLLRGFAAAPEVPQALERALGEALQSLAFLWDTEIPAGAPQLQPTPLYHLDYYLWPGSHGTLLAWLEGTGECRAWAPPAQDRRSVKFVDLTPASLRGVLHVVKAWSAQAVPLTFGEGPPWLTGDLPPSLRVHPIP